jgi:hypothetical protein
VTAKREVALLLTQQPDDATLEDIQYHLCVLEKIQRGRTWPGSNCRKPSRRPKAQAILLQVRVWSEHVETEAINVHYPDLSSYSYYLKSPLGNVLNVGWLDVAHDFPKDHVPDDFLPKLRALFCSAETLDVHVNKLRGWRPCSVCGVQCSFVFRGRQVMLGMSEIWIPGLEEDRYWAAPSMLDHYVDVHGYRPPQAFVDAVMSLSLDSNFNAQERYLELIKCHF